jgi:hypothetical protein
LITEIFDAPRQILPGQPVRPHTCATVYIVNEVPGFARCARQSAKFELVIHFKTAKTLGLNVPASFLQIADVVIK